MQADLIIFPDGQVGMCCNDHGEVTGFGDVSKEQLIDIWRNEKFRKLCRQICGGGNHYAKKDKETV